MSYLVLARKYRPQTFADMIGQEHVVRTLTNAIAADRVAHAFLFTGARGVGKTTSARLLAKALNCAEGPTAVPCGRCKPCEEIAAGSSVDVQEIDGASNNGVDQVRELRDNARYLPSRDRHKIYIIDEVHMLSGAAFNALLKTLEEPPGHVKFIFATTEPHKIPVTILSRTQRFDFRRIPLAKIVARIRTILESEGIAISDRGVALVAGQAEGSMRDALSLLDQVVSAGGTAIDDALVEEMLGVIDRTVVAGLAGALLERDGATVLDLVGRVFERGLDLKRLAEDLAWHLRNLMVVQVGGRALEVLDVADHERDQLQVQARQADPTTLAFLFDVAHGAAPEVGRAVQPRLALEVALLKAIHLAPGADVQVLLERVEALAARLGGAPGTGGGGRGPGAGGRGPGGGGSGPAAGGRGPTALRPVPSSRGASPPDHRTADASPPRGVSQEPPASPRAPAPAATAAPTDTGDRAPGPQTAAPSTRSVPPAVGSPSGAPRAQGAAAFAAIAERMAAASPAIAEPELEPPLMGEEPPHPADGFGAPPPEADGDPEPAGRSPAPVAAKQPARQAAATAEPPASAGPTAAAPAEKKPERRPAPEKRTTPDPKPDASGEAGADTGRLPMADDPSADLAARYERLVAAVAGAARRPFLAAALENARPLEVGEEELVLVLPRGLYHDGLNGAANRRVLEQCVSDHFGRPLRVRAELPESVKLDGVPEAIAVRKERELSQHVEGIRAEALGSPAVRLAVDLLDGEIENVRVLDRAP